MSGRVRRLPAPEEWVTPTEQSSRLYLMRKASGLILIVCGLAVLATWAIVNPVYNGVVILVVLLVGGGIALIAVPPKLPPYRRTHDGERVAGKGPVRR